jgi:hypothetical protein
MNKISPATRKKLQAAGRKGGQARVPKGFAKMRKELLTEVQEKGRQNYRRKHG